MMGVPPTTAFAEALNFAQYRRGSRPTGLKYPNAGSTRAQCAGLRLATETWADLSLSVSRRANPFNVASSPIFPAP